MLVVAALAVLGACSDDAGQAAPEVTITAVPTTSVSTTTTTTSAPIASAPTTTTEPWMPTFDAATRPVTEDELGGSWSARCPVPAGDLRRVAILHWNDAGEVQSGMLIVHSDHVEDLIVVFAQLFAAEFRIHEMTPVAAFDADDNASMAANNTSAFNCREIDGRPGVWSEHSYGGAVDINPLVNPWVRGSQVDPPQGAAYADREVDAVGIIRAGDVVTQAFADIGWQWGGDWASSKDYQHFSHNGR